MKRRQLLSCAIGAGIAVSAGCLDTDRDEYATIQRLTLINDRNDRVVTDLRIEHDTTEETVYEDSYAIGPGLDGVTIDCVWPDEPLRVMTRPADGNEWNSFSSANKEGCVIVASETSDSGTAFFTSNSECPVRSPDCHTDVED